MGGIFSEGIDLTNDKLIGTVVVGTGLPQVCVERDIIMNYFKDKGMNGFDYAYKYPGMNKVQQAAGRVIRTHEDTGIIALLDERFATREYGVLFPREWNDISYVNINEAGVKIDEFVERTYKR
jgi:Rad3-related DNA helicase